MEPATRSRQVGLPPRCMYPKMVALVSTPVAASMRRAMLEEPNQREAALELAELMHLKKDWPALVRACEACLAVKERRMSYLTKAEAWGSRPYDLYAIGLWYTGDRILAIRANEEAMRLDPSNERLRKNDELVRRIAGAEKTPSMVGIDDAGEKC